MPERIVLLSAGMGRGHDAVAAELIRRLRAAGHRARLVDVLELLPAGIGAGLRSWYRTTIRRFPFCYAALYTVFFRPGPGPRPGSAPLAALAEQRLLALVEQDRTDAVVPVFHLAAQLTGRLRARGALAAPVTVVVTDFVAHRQWLHPGNDLHLCLTPEAAGAAGRATGRPCLAAGPVVGAPPSSGPSEAESWRRRLDLRAPDRPAVLVSAGAWAAGTRMAATARLLAGAGYLPVVLCGRDERLRRAVQRSPGVLALGWQQDLAGLMAASRALVDNAAGQTALEALAAGLPVVGYRPIPGHGADGVREMAALGLTDHATGPGALLRSLDALTAPGPLRERRVAAGRRLFSGCSGVVDSCVRQGFTGVDEISARSGAATAAAARRRT